MTDLSKAFDYLSHELLIAKLEAYGFDEKSLKLIYNYLSNCKQRVKVNNSCIPGEKYYMEFLKDQY